jgi:uncharacterized membrane protein
MGKQLHPGTGMRLVISILVGFACLLILSVLQLGYGLLLIGWDIAAVLFILWTWLIIWPMSHNQTKEFARREDPSRVGADVILLLASIASLGAVGAALFQAHSTGNEAHATFLTITGIVSVVISWVLIHTIFTLRYARLFYGKTKDTIVFEKDHRPTFSDFAYISFTLGMTFQVSDNTIVGSGLRKVVLRHVLLSYLFGTVIVAATVNLIISLGH